MSLSPFSQNNIASKNWRTIQGARKSEYRNTSATSAWVRNPCWLPITAPTFTEQKFVSLYAVYDSETNPICFLFRGNYTIDWGDGTVENYSAGTVCYHNYSYSSSALDNTNGPVTFQGSADTVTRVSHGYQNGNTISFYSIATTTGIVAGQIYYVINATSDTFQLASTSGGSAIDLVNDGTGAILPYKQVIITATPQAGQNLTEVNLAVRNLTNAVIVQSFLDIAFGSPNLTTITICATGTGFASAAYCERFRVINGGTTTSISSICRDMHKLRRCEITLNNQNVTIGRAFEGCGCLTEIVLSGFGKVTSAGSLFYGCYSLQETPWLDTSTNTDFSSMFANCFLLKSIPLYDTSNATSISSMFLNCKALETIPFYNFSKVTSADSAFWGCSALRYIPHFDFSSVTYMPYAFRECYSLQTVPKLNLSKVTNIGQLFSNCTALRSVPDLQTTNLLTGCDYLFNGCYSLVEAPYINTSNVTNLQYMFNNCSSLKSIPLLDTSKSTNFSAFLAGCWSLESVPYFDTSKATNISYMFQYCSSLREIPKFDFSSVTNAFSTFQSCYGIKNYPLLDTSKITNFDRMFWNNKITSLPAFDLSSGTALGLFTSTVNGLRDFAGYGMKVSFSLIYQSLSANALTTVMNNLATVASVPQTFTITSNYGAPTPVSLSGTTTAGSTTITMASTTGITAGMQVTGIGTPLTTPIAVTFQDSGDTVTLVAHGLSNGDEVSFAAITSTTGIIINKIYYVVNAAADTFQVAATLGGAALSLTTDGSGTLRYRTEVVSIVANTSVTLTRPATSSGTNTLSYQTLKTGTALLKGWTVSQ